MDTEKYEKEYLRAVGKRVQEARKSVGMSQERLSELAGIHPTYVSRIERGANASLGIYMRIVAALRIPLVELLDVNKGRIAPDPLMRTFGEIKALPVKEQRMIHSAIKGLMGGMKEKAK